MQELVFKQKDSWRFSRAGKIAIKQVVETTADYTGYTIEALMGRSRVVGLAKTRLVMMFLLRKHTQLSFPQIGKVCVRDHSTVMAACRAVLKDPRLVDLAAAIEERFVDKGGQTGYG